MSIDEIIAGQLQARRKEKGWSLDTLAQQSGVSKAMISKIERQASSPSAATLGRLAAGLGIALAELITEHAPQPYPLRRRAQQPVWRDPDLGYLRRQVSEKSDGQGAELVEITLPAGARINYPRWNAAPYRQQLWVCEGSLDLTYGDTCYTLATGDCLSFGVDAPLTFANPGSQPCRYLLVMTSA
ncbi:XRE family transcriptional regulator [Chimaeribacter arupi]|uniref:Helix-turn-helix domain-containing protein n=1 Tax=Nissabacter archeti TaxID=1917880 RepID=A0ABS5JIQ1_9GAMM|nr:MULTISPECIES: helix-turn-helix domain-containing protein [Yersiniaceae]MBS0969851.1 helix-turn-helix domain-containing protein [Nissabacter archeti]PLR49085.1 XRE family transcriptional regulator [Chimaeribacter arupi]WKZ91081.1 helix-turn-helix domain-containing protein [Chimaeribacter arupi]